MIPALGIYEHLRNNFETFITTDIRGSKFIDSNKFDFNIIDIPNLQNNLFKIPLNIMLLIISIVKSLIFLKKKKINVIISTGGYMSLPICLLSQLFNTKLYLFEPNMVIGRSNLFLIKYCSKIFCYSNEIKKFPSKYQNKLKLINPILNKNSYLVKKKVFSNVSKKKNILIIGGSQGANYFQTQLKEFLINLSEKFQIFVYHQTNDINFEVLKKFYEDNNISFKLFKFEKNLNNIYSTIDLCITRSGASSLAELIYFEVPFIAVPFPYSKDNHQFYNASYYEKKNCCWMIEQKNISKNSFLSIAKDIIDNKKSIKIKKESMKKINFNHSWGNNNQILIKTINEN